MPLRSDILRGVRLAAVAFVLVLLGALVYRSVDISAKSHKAPVPQVVVAPATASAPASVPGSPAPPTQGVPNQAIPKQGGVLAQVHGTAVRPAANATRKAAAAGSKSEPETMNVAAQPSEPPPTDTAAVAKEEEVKVRPPEEAVSPPLATMPEASADAGSGENRGKRMIKAVGRFLRIGGKKEVDPQPQPQPARPKPIQQ